MNPITGLLTALGGLTVMFVGVWTRVLMAARRSPGGSQSPATDTRVPSALDLGIGAVTNFFDTLGIGSFATTTAIFRLWQLVPDRIIPGTLNAGHTLPTVVQAFIYTSVIPVDVLTLFSMITAAVLGAWLGAGVVACWPKRKVQIGMGAALLAAAVFMLMKQLQPHSATRQRGDRGARREARPGRWRQLPARRADDARDRPVCPVHDSREPARHEPSEPRSRS